jgi:hypothetical protein
MNEVAPDPTSQRALARAKWIAANISDKTLQGAFVRAVTETPQNYSPDELEQIQEGLDMEAEVNQSSKLKPIKVSTPLLDKAVAMTSKDGQHNIVQSSATIRAPVMVVMASIFCVEGEVDKILSSEEGWSAELLGSENEHCAVVRLSV